MEAGNDGRLHAGMQDRATVTEHNAGLVRRAVEEIWNGGDLALADVLFAPDYVNHGGLIPDLVRGPEAIKVQRGPVSHRLPELPYHRGGAGGGGGDGGPAVVRARHAA